MALSFLVAGCFSCNRAGTSAYDFPDNPNQADTTGGKDSPTAGKRCFIWVDCSANFPYFANSEDNIDLYMKKTADCGFTDVIVDIRPTNGDVLYKTEKCEQVHWMGAWYQGQYVKVDRTADFDYLQAFIDAGHKYGMKVYAGFNTFVGGHSSGFGNVGVVFRDSKYAALATMLNRSSGIISIMKDGLNTKFFNPVHKDVQTYLIGLLEDLAAYGKTGLDGIILDRGRFVGFASDFSDYTKTAFEDYIGTTVQNWPSDVLPVGYTTEAVPNPVPTYFLKWNEFRAKTIHDFMVDAREAVKAVSPDLDFGAYVGAWYSSYYPNGVNWASPRYNTALNYPSWASAKYSEYGYADHMDVLVVGAYASPGSVYGTTEWTMQGFCSLAMEKTKGDAGCLVGGPDIGNWDSSDKYTWDEENQAIVNSVKACADACNGYFLFDIIDLINHDQWDYVKKGIDALGNR